MSYQKPCWNQGRLSSLVNKQVWGPAVCLTELSLTKVKVQGCFKENLQCLSVVKWFGGMKSGVWMWWSLWCLEEWCLDVVELVVHEECLDVVELVVQCLEGQVIAIHTRLIDRSRGLRCIVLQRFAMQCSAGQ